jgi:hypothetical protein
MALSPFQATLHGQSKRKTRQKQSVHPAPARNNKKKGLKGPFLMTRFLPSRKAECLTSAKKACLPYHCSLMVPKRKRRAYALLLLATFRYCFFLSSAQRRMDALQANHDERPANPCGRAHPFSSVHPYGPPCEGRAEALGPSCLCSIAQALTAAANLRKQWQGNLW